MGREEEKRPTRNIYREKQGRGRDGERRRKTSKKRYNIKTEEEGSEKEIERPK